MGWSAPNYKSLHLKYNRDRAREQKAFLDKQGLWKECKQTVPTFYLPVDYADCFTNYLPPQWDYVVCPNFGNCDILDVQCHRCHDLFFYQWAMCQDESWVLQMMNGGRDSKTAKYGAECSREEAQLHIMRYKKMLYDLNFGSDVDAAYDDFNESLYGENPPELKDRLEKNRPANYKSPAQAAEEAIAEKKRLAENRRKRAEAAKKKEEIECR